jgi:hypothetical protein
VLTSRTVSYASKNVKPMHAYEMGKNYDMSVKIQYWAIFVHIYIESEGIRSTVSPPASHTTILLLALGCAASDELPKVCEDSHCEGRPSRASMS